ncbi:major facilitator superfamily domain-containing protein [Podospora aff. communis PSN243]|uniref:Major facilitator superfamily domain-containing protein n=1 Tax=Podospora aff. communis PSN243 TaxID=3040156 RepID=A0AAV9H0M7_9PEZI|nr:major facilitator superfamily domain-containing protein [Podospora aff. communis PSN243]
MSATINAQARSDTAESLKNEKSFGIAEGDDDVYSTFSSWQRNCIVGLAAFAGWFSSISSFIYFPAIPFLAQDLGAAIQQINLTVTAYLVMSGIFPSIMGDAADRFGRRPVLLVGLTVYFCANLGLAAQSHLGLLFAFRVLQSAGISGTFSVAYGVLGDLFTPAERGWYSGVLAFFLNTPPSIGPLLSGLLLLRWTWRSIFWFLSASSAICLLLMVLLLPETARNIVGNGITQARSPFNKPLIPLLSPPSISAATTFPSSTPQKRHPPNPLASLLVLTNPSTALLLLVYAINYSVYSALQASLSTLFVSTYHITGLTAGLIYLPFGIACAISTFATGKLLDVDFRRTASSLGVAIQPGKATDLRDFPVEKARVRSVVYTVALCATLVVAYGWMLEKEVTMAGVLVVQGSMGLVIQPVFTALNTLLVDVHPQAPATAQAACNFVRCEMAAGCLAGLDALLGRVGCGFGFLLFGCAVGLEVVMLSVLQWRGLSWRRARARRGG